MTHNFRWWQRLSWGVTVLSAGTLLAARTSGVPDVGPAVPGTPRSTASATGAPSDGSAPAVAGPGLADGDSVVAAVGETRGSAALMFGEGRRGDALIVVIRCVGHGELVVGTEPLGTERTVPCEEGEVSEHQDVLDVSGVEDAGTVSVRAPSRVRWAMTVGRGEPPERERAV